MPCTPARLVGGVDDTNYLRSIILIHISMYQRSV
nr:MAG TPA: hypothetical protein [Caudoviricetes sp.]